MSRYGWTTPYYGGSHYTLLRRGGPVRQATVEEHDGWAVAWLLGPTGFTPIVEQTFPSVGEARSWAERMVRELGGAS